MKNLLLPAVLAAFLAALSAQPRPAMSGPTMGAGPHGYDWLLGTWSCANSTPSAMAGPANSSYTVSRTNAGALLVRTTGKNFDSSTYVTYAPKTKTWWGPAAFADGSYEIESSAGSGRKVTWNGTYTSAASGKTMKVRDIYTLLSSTKQTDVGQYQSGGTWKGLYKVTCTKS